MSHRRARTGSGGVLAAWALAAFALVAQGEARAAEPQYPSRPVRLIVPWPPGGGSDVVSRIIAQRMSEGFGQQVVVDNRGGAATIIGTELIARAAPDGYTLGFATSNFAVNPALYPKLSFDAVRDFAPVMLAVKGLYVLVVHPSVPAKTVGDLVALSKAAPAKLNVALTGAGTPTHLGLEQFNSLVGVKLTGINYKGAGPAVASVLSGETQVMFVSMPTVSSHVQAGKLRLIAVTGESRSSVVPDMPTVAESGLPGFALSEWYGYLFPARVQPAHVKRVNDELRRVLAIPDTRQRLAAVGADIVASSPAEFGAFIRAELAKWGKLVREAGIKAE